VRDRLLDLLAASVVLARAGLWVAFLLLVGWVIIRPLFQIDPGM
jgi:hypothetical protein